VKSYLKLFQREVIFELFQPVLKTYLNVTNGRTDGQTTLCGIRALYTSHGTVITPPSNNLGNILDFLVCAAGKQLNESSSTCS